MKNKLTDLNDILFAQLERLADENLEGEAIGAEIRRADAIVAVADTIVENASLQLAAAKLVAEHGDRVKLPMIGAGSPTPSVKIA
jgi:hypothetical protein